MSKVRLAVQSRWEDCSECFERVEGRLAPGAGRRENCKSTIFEFLRGAITAK